MISLGELFRFSRLIRCHCKSVMLSNAVNTGRNKKIKKSFHLHYSQEEEGKILTVLNECTSFELKRYNVGNTRSANITHFRDKNGKYSELSDILKVEGVGIKILQQMCDNILLSSEKQNCIGKGESHLKRPMQKKNIQIVTPQMEESRRSDVKTIVGIHIESNSVSWAKLNQEQVVTNWNSMGLEDLRKVHPTGILETAVSIKNSVPDADIYVMEDIRSSQQTVVTVRSVQLFQLRAMLLTLFNSCGMKDTDPQDLCRVYFLRSNTAARMFNLLIGSEKVSVDRVIKDIFQGCGGQNYGPIFVGNNLQALYMSKNSVCKENLGQALLLTIAFMNLILFKRT